MATATDLSRRFGGVDRLYGDGALSRANQAHVCVIGIGGVGSWAVEALARSGVGKLTLIDLDHVAESNMNRQIHALEETLGLAKVIAMRERIAAINPACEVRCIEEFITEDNIATLLPECDAVIDAIDNVRAKAALIAHCRRNKVAMVTTGGAGGRTDPTRVEIDDLSRTVQDALASKVRARLRKEYGFSRDPKKKFGIDCVFSQEQIRRPLQGPGSFAQPPTGAGAEQCSANSPHRPASADLCTVPIDGAAGLACAGYGSSVAVTAAFGFAAAARVLAGILQA
jgi:tRNA A37 threonylcarbamoyladenosine dehydratase